MPRRTALYIGIAWMLALVTTAATGCGESAEPAPAEAGPPAVVKLRVEGMTCEGCVRTITQKVQAMSGVRNVVVSLEDKSATVTTAAGGPTLDAIAAVINEAGYQAGPLPPSTAPAG